MLSYDRLNFPATNAQTSFPTDERVRQSVYLSGKKTQRESGEKRYREKRPWRRKLVFGVVLTLVAPFKYLVNAGSHTNEGD